MTTPTFQQELEQLVNKHSMENGSNTPDYILSAYLNQCLVTFNTCVDHREKWYGRRSAEIKQDSV
jgi:hypothetical protein